MGFELFGLMCSTAVFVCALLNALQTRRRAMFALVIGFALDNILCAANIAAKLVHLLHPPAADYRFALRCLFYLRVGTETPAVIITTGALVVLLLTIPKRRRN